MVLRYDAVVSDEFSYYLRILVENTQQGRGENDSLLSICFCVSHGESQPRESLACTSRDIEPEYAGLFFCGGAADVGYLLSRPVYRSCV